MLWVDEREIGNLGEAPAATEGNTWRGGGDVRLAGQAEVPAQAGALAGGGHVRLGGISRVPPRDVARLRSGLDLKKRRAFGVLGEDVVAALPSPPPGAGESPRRAPHSPPSRCRHLGSGSAPPRSERGDFIGSSGLVPPTPLRQPRGATQPTKLLIYS